MLLDTLKKITFGMELETTDRGVCFTCDGEGEVRCPDCDYGYNECHTCDGTGEVEVKIEGEWAWSECPRCGGEGRLLCSTCGGNEYLLCPDCEGGGSFGDPIDTPAGWNDHSEHCGWEYVSPVFSLFGESMPNWNQLFRWVRNLEVDPNGNPPTGLHIHVGIDNITNNPIPLLERVAQIWEEVEEEYCNIADVTEEREEWAGTCAHRMGTIKEILREGKDVNYHLRGLDRYVSLNFAAYPKHSTVEFRLWNGTDNPTYLRYAILYSIALVVYASMTIYATKHVTNVEPMTGIEKLVKWLGKNIFGRSQKKEVAA